MYKHKIWHLIGVFTFAFGFIVICYLGLPIDFNRDYLIVCLGSLTRVDYSELIKLTLNPLTPGWLYPPDRLMEYLRPITTLLFQLGHQWMPYSLIPFHLAAALGHGLLAIYLFVIIDYFTKRALYGWLAVIFYASLPSNFFMMSSISSFDFQYFVSVLSLTALALFYYLTLGRFKRPLTFCLFVVLWIMTVWINIKLKSSEKILPFVFLFFLLIKFPFILKRIALRRISLLFVGITSMMLLVVPLKPFESWIHAHPSKQGTVVVSADKSAGKKETRALSFKWKNAVQRTFFIPGGNFPFTTLQVRKTPRSVSENFGFFPSWILWVGLLLLPILQKKQQKQSDLDEENKIHGTVLILVWFFVILAGFSSGADLMDLRFLNFAYVPGIFLLFLIISNLEHFLFKSIPLIFAFVIASIMIFTSVLNFGQLAKLVGHFSGIQDALVRAERDVYTDFFNEEPKGRSLYERHQELEDRAVLVNWYQLPVLWMNLAKEKINREGQLYFYTRELEPERLTQLRQAGYSAKLWKRYNFFDAKPVLFGLFKQINALSGRYRNRKAQNSEVIVYKIGKP